jgi:hypothetical protein
MRIDGVADVGRNVVPLSDVARKTRKTAELRSALQSGAEVCRLKNSAKAGTNSLKNPAKAGTNSLKNPAKAGTNSLKNPAKAGTNSLKNPAKAGTNSLKNPAKAGFCTAHTAGSGGSGGLEGLDARGQAALMTGGFVLVDQAAGAEAIEDRLGHGESSFGACGVVGVEGLEHFLDGGAQHGALGGVTGIAHDGLLSAFFSGLDVGHDGILGCCEFDRRSHQAEACERVRIPVVGER